jgi:hypothetical protein
MMAPVMLMAMGSVRTAPISVSLVQTFSTLMKMESRMRVMLVQRIR